MFVATTYKMASEIKLIRQPALGERKQLTERELVIDEGSTWENVLL